MAELNETMNNVHQLMHDFSAWYEEWIRRHRVWSMVRYGRLGEPFRASDQETPND